MAAEEIVSLDRNLALDAVRVTEAAARAAARLIGRGDEMAADQAAVDAMRRGLNALDIAGTVVIGEGERDEAPMLYIGETVGTGKGPSLDVALDPLEGTTICATGGPNALAVLAMAEQGGFLAAPDTYMDKIAVGDGLPDELIDLDDPPATTLAKLAKAKACDVNELTVLILDRPRHEELIAKVRETQARIQLIRDGDVAGVIATTRLNRTVDIYIGIGGAPEGVLAAAALRCIGGQMMGRLALPQRRREEARAPNGRHRPGPQVHLARARGRQRDVLRDRGHRRRDAARSVAPPQRRADQLRGHALPDRHRAHDRGRARLLPRARPGRHVTCCNAVGPGDSPPPPVPLPTRSYPSGGGRSLRSLAYAHTRAAQSRRPGLKARQGGGGTQTAPPALPLLPGEERAGVRRGRLLPSSVV